MVRTIFEYIPAQSFLSHTSFIISVIVMILSEIFYFGPGLQQNEPDLYSLSTTPLVLDL